jgi:hypothetical protein
MFPVPLSRIRPNVDVNVDHVDKSQHVQHRAGITEYDHPSMKRLNARFVAKSHGSGNPDRAVLIDFVVDALGIHGERDFRGFFGTELVGDEAFEKFQSVHVTTSLGGIPE